MACLNPYLSFNGQCEAAFKYYEKCLGGKIAMMMSYKDSPIAKHVPPDWHNKILHATLILNDCVLQGADAPPKTYQTPQGFSVMLNIKTSC